MRGGCIHKRVGCRFYSRCLDEAVRSDDPVNCGGCARFRPERQTESERLAESLRACALLLALWPELSGMEEPASFEPLRKLIDFPVIRWLQRTP